MTCNGAVEFIKKKANRAKKPETGFAVYTARTSGTMRGDTEADMRHRVNNARHPDEGTTTFVSCRPDWVTRAFF